jgi:hypothetical protein
MMKAGLPHLKGGDPLLYAAPSHAFASLPDCNSSYIRFTESSELSEISSIVHCITDIADFIFTSHREYVRFLLLIVH